MLVVKNLPANAGDSKFAVSIPGSGRPSGVGNGNPVQYSCLENPMDRGTWQATALGVAKSNMTDSISDTMILKLTVMMIARIYGQAKENIAFNILNG